MKIEVAQRVLEFARGLPPDPRRAMRRALRDLAEGRGDTKQLQGELADFHRLRVMSNRVIFHYVGLGGTRGIRCVYAAARDRVYAEFGKLLEQGQMPD